ncbi:hypothetical protein, partial [Prevotella pectinovora]|uniref:hypothetical protein n=1 Tax=Prevotella pectinovora TaxID=1602169 RepID=UPI00307CBA57
CIDLQRFMLIPTKFPLSRHFTADQSFAHDCVICQLHSLPYVVPTIANIAAFIAMANVVFVMSCPFVKTRKTDIHSTRAPPAFLSF